MYYAYQKENVVVLFAIQKNGNKKVALHGQLILNQYTFSREQWEMRQYEKPFEWFGADTPNCLDCKYKGVNGKCYTHKYHSFLSFMYHIKRAKKKVGENPVPIEKFDWDKLYKQAEGLFIRFGVYGEPVFVPVENMEKLIKKAYTYTGYTHAWDKYPEYKDLLLASCDGVSEAFRAISEGWKPYTIIKKKEELDGNEKNFVNCPASKEAGQKTVCSICKLCSPAKSSKPIYILEH